VVCLPLWNILVGMIIPNIWENKIHVPNHQPVINGSCPWFFHGFYWESPPGSARALRALRTPLKRGAVCIFILVPGGDPCDMVGGSKVMGISPNHPVFWWDVPWKSYFCWWIFQENQTTFFGILHFRKPPLKYELYNVHSPITCGIQLPCHFHNYHDWGWWT